MLGIIVYIISVVLAIGGAIFVCWEDIVADFKYLGTVTRFCIQKWFKR